MLSRSKSRTSTVSPSKVANDAVKTSFSGTGISAAGLTSSRSSVSSAMAGWRVAQRCLHLAQLPSVPQVTVPTTLSAGECSAISGVTDERHRVKELIRHPYLIPRAVVLDGPAVSYGKGAIVGMVEFAPDSP